jgi:hypothetical protein
MRDDAVNGSSNAYTELDTQLSIVFLRHLDSESIPETMR